MEKQDSFIHRPQSPSGAGTVSTYIKPQGRKVHDPDVAFEEYQYYALRTREEEKKHIALKTSWKSLLFKKSEQEVAPLSDGTDSPPPLKLQAGDFANSSHRLEISDEEWTNASRSFRTASWGACKRNYSKA